MVELHRKDFQSDEEFMNAVTAKILKDIEDYKMDKKLAQETWERRGFDNKDDYNTYMRDWHRQRAAQIKCGSIADEAGVAAEVALGTWTSAEDRKAAYNKAWEETYVEQMNLKGYSVDLENGGTAKRILIPNRVRLVFELMVDKEHWTSESTKGMKAEETLNLSIVRLGNNGLTPLVTPYYYRTDLIDTQIIWGEKVKDAK